MSVSVRVYPDLITVSRATGRALVDQIHAGLGMRPTFSLALSGGHTPRTLYQLLARDFKDAIPWTRLHLFWSDERNVPRDDPQSNYRLVRETLLDVVPIPRDHVHPIPTGFPSPPEAAQAYERTLQAHFTEAPPRFDLILLGMGPDGHIASIFPGSPAAEEHTRWVVAVRTPVAPAQRLTLTFPVINAAASVFVLVTGAEKAEALKRALAEEPDPLNCPASAIHPIAGSVVWWVDEAAAVHVPASMVEVRASA